jgi:hypothetical protein
MKFTISKIDAAVEQMDWAIKLFLDHQAYVPAITLAGATEEIVGEVLGGKSVFSQLKRNSARSTSFQRSLCHKHI